MANRRYIAAFINGFLYVFGLSDNPIKRTNENYRSNNDNEALSKDWENVGSELKNAFDVETKQAECSPTC